MTTIYSCLLTINLYRKFITSLTGSLSTCRTCTHGNCNKRLSVYACAFCNTCTNVHSHRHEHSAPHRWTICQRSSSSISSLWHIDNVFSLHIQLSVCTPEHIQTHTRACNHTARKWVWEKEGIRSKPHRSSWSRYFSTPRADCTQLFNFFEPPLSFNVILSGVQVVEALIPANQRSSQSPILFPSIQEDRLQIGLSCLCRITREHVRPTSAKLGENMATRCQRAFCYIVSVRPFNCGANIFLSSPRSILGSTVGWVVSGISFNITPLNFHFSTKGE